MTTDGLEEYFKGTSFENNPSAQRIVREWVRKATKDAGNYYTRKLDEIGFCVDSRSGLDWGCEMPLKNNEQ